MNTDWVLTKVEGDKLSYKKNGKIIEFEIYDSCGGISQEFKEYAAYISPIGKHFHSKESKDEFDKLEANCNTCKYLERVKHEKCYAGFLKGKCKKTGECLVFHPQDPMGKECYEHRKEENK